MPDVLLPLSGDVTQSINPWSWTIGALTGQIGLVNINLGRSADPTLEEQILREVGSYGRQLGRMGEALQVLLAQLDRRKLSDEQKKALWAFETQMEEIGRLKRGRTQAPRKA